MSGVVVQPDTVPHEAAGELELRKERNLEFLRHVLPEGYERFKDYQPQTLGLRWDPEVGPVVQGIRSGLSAYPAPPLDYARAQVEAFCRKPAVRTSQFAPKEILQLEEEVHTKRANRVIELLNAEPRDPVGSFHGFANTLFVFGLGLGYHVYDLLEAADVHHLCIIEPDPDLFHAALHTVEWAALAEHFARPGYSLEVVLERSPEEAARQISSWFDQIGGHNAVEVYWFKHRGGRVMEETARLLARVVLPHFRSFLGYFDDERISLAHTTANVAAGVPLLADRDSEGASDAPGAVDAMPPLFVVANGPSLDEAVDFLKENRDRGIVLSCGTALGSLVKAGIVPDIHVEMERTRPVWEWIVQATTPEQRERIHLVALNPVHPDVLQLFPNATLALRAFDLGAAWMERRLAPGVTPRVVTAPGPTVGNCGLALGDALGFRDMTLFGLDLGYPVGDQHHSRFSVHYRVGAAHQGTLGVYDVDDPANPTAPGNFGGEVRTTPVYLDAAERVAQMVAADPELRIRNTSRGLAIRGVEAVAADEIVPGPGFDTAAFVGGLMARLGARSAVTPLSPSEEEDIRERVTALSTQVRGILAHPVEAREEAMTLLLLAHMQLHHEGAAPEMLEALLLLRGSVAHLFLLLAQALHVRADETEALELFRQGREILMELLEDVESRAAGADFLALDDKTRELARKVAAG